ncbi:MAG: hypothetical protein LBI91_03595 [Spirochaetaceae bacterium]|jgi:hypothetical protein|nr:hypothetical protein [Spirochaetaceae bacterium]
MNSLVLSAGSLILSGFTFVFFLAYLKRRTGRDRILTELLADLREEAAKIERDINAATDRDVTLVEDRVKTLRALLEDADRRIAVYVREFERRRSQEETFAALDREKPVNAANTRLPAGSASRAPGGPDMAPAVPAAESAASGHDGAETPVYLPSELFRPAAAPIPPAEAVPAVPEPAAAYGKRVTRSAKPLAPKPLPFAERVAELYRAGFSSSLIASRLGATVTEVELAIALAGRSGR